MVFGLFVPIASALRQRHRERRRYSGIARQGSGRSALRDDAMRRHADFGRPGRACSQDMSVRTTALDDLVRQEMVLCWRAAADRRCSGLELTGKGGGPSRD
jgi:hypothetical protein